jgi:hypothetical protein
MKDPIVEKIRQYRMEHTRKFRGDLSAICKDVRAIQETSGHQVVRLPARRMEPTKPAGGQRAGRGR